MSDLLNFVLKWVKTTVGICHSLVAHLSMGAFVSWERIVIGALNPCCVCQVFRSREWVPVDEAYPPQALGCVECTRPTTYDDDACPTNFSTGREKLWGPRLLLFSCIGGVRCHINLAIGDVGLEGMNGRRRRCIFYIVYEQENMIEGTERTDQYHPCIH